MADREIRSKLRSKIRGRIYAILALIIVSGIFIAPKPTNGVIDKINDWTKIGIPRVPETEFRLGLDLQGGVHLVYEADVTQVPVNEENAALEGVRDVIERRVNGMGVGEPNVQTTKVGESHRLIVELPGVTDVHAAISMIGETPILEFKEQNNEPPRELTDEEQKELVDANKVAKQRAQDTLNEIRSGASFDETAGIVSEDHVSRNNNGYVGFVGSNHPLGDLADAVRNAAEGSVHPVLVDNLEGHNIVKRGATRDGEQEVRASHLLICYLGATNCSDPQYTKEEAEQKAQELYDVANAENFVELAKENSSDLANAGTGGDLGWFKRGAMVPAFEEASFSSDVGSIIGPVETQFGFHVIHKVDERSQQEVEISRILVRTKSERDILPPQDPFVSTGLSGKQLERAEVVSDPTTGLIQVSLQFDSEGAKLFRELTEKNIGLPIAIYLDGEPISIPNVSSVIPDGRAVIQGQFTLQDARLLSQRLNAGALPVPIDLISQQAIGPTLGAISLQKSLKAGIVGLMLVMLFMLLYYRLPGFLSLISLTLYVALTLAIFKLIGVTLTLAGIAGFILSIGMAVDANVLIFERLKEELRDGKSLRVAVEEGFVRAWTSIRDGNISTLITCALLIWFGSSFVQGFAVTLAIGVLISMFTAISVTRVMLRFVVPWFDKNRGKGFFLGSSGN